jgi:hypothetical protein
MNRQSLPAGSLLTRLLARLRGVPSVSTTPVTKARPYQAVAVFRGNPCCALARRFDEHRFLAKDAPSLPLSGCSMPQKCTCRFLKFKDRRDVTPRRLMEFGASALLFAGKERRGVRGRRVSDR